MVNYLCIHIAVILVSVFVYSVKSQTGGGCYDEETKFRWAVGESYNPIGRCISMNCASENGAFSAVTCATYVPPGNDCEVIEEDLTKPYPECCSTMKCKEKTKTDESYTDGKVETPSAVNAESIIS